MADTAISIIANINSNTLLGFGIYGPYWVSASVGAEVYVNANDDLVAQKTSDSGATWGTYVVAEAVSVTAFQCWFDRETPGNTGTKVHCAWVDSVGGDLTYAAYDINADTWSTPVYINASTTVGAAGGSVLSIAGTRAGGFVVTHCNPTIVSEAFKSTDGVTWNSITDPYESVVADITLGVSVNTGNTADSGMLFWDRSADEVSLKMYSDTLNTWTETAIAAGVEITTSVGWSRATRLSDGLTIALFWNATDSVAADYRAYALTCNSIALPTITALTNVLTDSAESGASGCFIDQTNDDLYAVYARGSAYTATVQIFYKKSTDDGATWGTETAMSEDAEDDFRAIGGGAMGPTQGGRFQPSWFDDDDNDIFINLTNDIEIAAVGGGSPVGLVLAGKALHSLAMGRVVY